MKKQFHKIIPVLFLITLVFPLACRKKAVQPSLPATTQEGANTFGTIVDGEIWLPSNSANLEVRRLCVSYNSSNDFSIGVEHDMEGTNQAAGGLLGITYKNLSGTGTYDLTDANRATLITSVEGVDGLVDTFTVLSGVLKITRFDRTNNIISGTFSFKIKNNNQGNTHEAVHGRFDVNFDHCR